MLLRGAARVVVLQGETCHGGNIVTVIMSTWYCITSISFLQGIGRQRVLLMLICGNMCCAGASLHLRHTICS
jgi:hypothetical protein